MHTSVLLVHTYFQCNYIKCSFYLPSNYLGDTRESDPRGQKFCPLGANFWPLGSDAPITWKFGLPATSRLGCNPDPTFFEWFTRRHMARARWHAAPRDRRHCRSAVPAHRMSRLSSGSAQPFRRYSLGICRSLIRDVMRDISWQLALRAW